jgi:hypothetical protein
MEGVQFCMFSTWATTANLCIRNHVTEVARKFIVRR